LFIPIFLLYGFFEEMKNRSSVREGDGGKGTLIKIITSQKKLSVGNNTLFTLCLLLKKFFV